MPWELIRGFVSSCLRVCPVDSSASADTEFSLDSVERLVSFYCDSGGDSLWLWIVCVDKLGRLVQSILLTRGF